MTLRQGFRKLIRKILLSFRVYPGVDLQNVNPNSAEYLYLVQQQKRLALVVAFRRLRWFALPLWPILIVFVAFRWLDLEISNSLIRSMMNEMDLLRMSTEADS